MKRIDVSKVPNSEVIEWVKEALKRPSDFGYFGGNEEMFKTWSLGPVIETRDSDALERSNARVLQKTLEDHPEWNDDWSLEHCNHWAVGWVDHLAFRAIDDNGEPTNIAKFLYEWFDYLENGYCVADEDDYSELEEEERQEDWNNFAGRDFVYWLSKTFKLSDPTIDWLHSHLDDLYSFHMNNCNDYSVTSFTYLAYVKRAKLAHFIMEVRKRERQANE